MSTARRGIWGVIGAHAAGESRPPRRRKVELASDTVVVAELPEVAERWLGKGQRVEPADAGRVGYRERRNRVGVRAQREKVAEILQAAAHLDLVAHAIGDRAVDAR